MSNQCEAIVAYFKLFPIEGIEITDFDSMKDCIVPTALFQFFHGDELDLTKIKEAVQKNEWFLRLKEIKALVAKLEECLKGTPYANQKIDTTALARREDKTALEIMVTQIAYYSFKSTKKTEAISAIKQLSKEHQVAMKNIIKPPESAASPPSPSSPSSSAPTAPPAASTASSSSASTATSVDVLADIKAKIEEITKANESLLSENEKLRTEVNELKTSDTAAPSSGDANADEDDEHIVPKIASINAELFVMDQGIKTKQNKKSQLTDMQKQLITLQDNIDKAKNEMKELSGRLESEEKGGPDYTILTERLQQLRLEQETTNVTNLVNQLKEIKSAMRQVNKQKSRLQAKLDGQQGIAVLEDRKRFLENLVLNNIKRKQRAELHLALAQKKMRSDAFQQEMRSFI